MNIRVSRRRRLVCQADTPPLAGNWSRVVVDWLQGVGRWGVLGGGTESEDCIVHLGRSGQWTRTAPRRKRRLDRWDRLRLRRVSSVREDNVAIDCRGSREVSGRLGLGNKVMLRRVGDWSWDGLVHDLTLLDGLGMSLIRLHHSWWLVDRSRLRGRMVL